MLDYWKRAAYYVKQRGAELDEFGRPAHKNLTARQYRRLNHKHAHQLKYGAKRPNETTAEYVKRQREFRKAKR